VFAIRACEREPVMSVFRRVLLSVCLLVLPGAAALAKSTEWKTMIHVDLSRPGPMSWLAPEIWPDVSAEENAYLRDVLKRYLPEGGNSLRVEFATFDVDGRSYLVSTVLSLGCETGANNAASSAEPSLCPLRISMKEPSGWKTLVSGKGCFVEPQDGTAPPAHRLDNAQAQFDPVRRVFRLRANIGGNWIAACTRMFPIP